MLQHNKIAVYVMAMLMVAVWHFVLSFSFYYHQGQTHVNTGSAAAIHAHVRNKPVPSSSSCSIYFHLHIQKAGGTAFNGALASSSHLSSGCQCQKGYKYMPGCCKPALLPSKCGNSYGTGNRSVAALYSRLTNGWKCGVHAPLHAIQTCSDLPTSVPTRIVTMLRNPVDRIVSEYKHCGKNRFQKCWAQYSFEKEPSLEQFTLKAGNDMPYQNRQTKMTSGCPTGTTVWSNPVKARKCLEQAKRHIRDRFFFVGIHEEFHSSLRALSKMMGEDLVAPTENVHNITAQYTTKWNTWEPAFIAKIAEKEVYDMELYRFASNLFHERYGKHDKMDVSSE